MLQQPPLALYRHKWHLLYHFRYHDSVDRLDNLLQSFKVETITISSLDINTLADEDTTRTKDKEPLEGLGGPMPRARTKKAKEALQQVLTMLIEFRPKLQVEKLRIVNYTMFMEE